MEFCLQIHTVVIELWAFFDKGGKVGASVPYGHISLICNLLVVLAFSYVGEAKRPRCRSYLAFIDLQVDRSCNVFFFSYFFSFFRTYYNK